MEPLGGAEGRQVTGAPLSVTVLGAGGFIGSNLVEHLIDHTSHDIVGIDRARDKLAGIHGDNFEFHQAELTVGGGDLEPFIKETDVVIDLIAYANPSLYVESPLEVFELNFIHNLQVARLCVEHRTRLVQVSTSEVYGDAIELEFDEDTSPMITGPVQKQRWIYASAKQLLERVIHAHGLRDELDYTIVRPFNFLGPRIDYLVPAGSMGGPRVFAHFMSSLLTGGPMFLVNGGEVHRCFTHIADAVEAFRIILEHPGAHNQIFNVGHPGNDTSIRDLALLMQSVYAELTGESGSRKLATLTGDDFYGEGYDDMNRVPPRIDKMRALGWEPKLDLRTAVRDAMAYYLAEVGKL